MAFHPALVATALLWLLALAMFRSSTDKAFLRSCIFSITGVMVLGGFLASLWLRLGHPPMQTLGETRLWYSFCLVIIGMLAYRRWKFSWFVPLSTLLALVFLLINLFSPRYYDRPLMPALRSPWFVPHVILFIFSYAALGAAALIALRELWVRRKEHTPSPDILPVLDNLVGAGLSMFTLAMLFGALWAKQAWGHYWTWDPKETWALITWMTFKIYLHYRVHRPEEHKAACILLFSAFLILLICWFGVNYLPSALTSIHVYSG